MVNVGIIGAGRIGQVHAKSILTGVPDAKILAIADPFIKPEVAEWAQSGGIETVYTEHRKILEDPRIDAVLIPSHFDGSVKAYLDWICVLQSCRHRGAAQSLLAALRERLKALGVDTLIALTAANEEAQRFYKSVPDSIMRDVGIWIDIK